MVGIINQVRKQVDGQNYKRASLIKSLQQRIKAKIKLYIYEMIISVAIKSKIGKQYLKEIMVLIYAWSEDWCMDRIHEISSRLNQMTYNNGYGLDGKRIQEWHIVQNNNNQKQKCNQLKSKILSGGGIYNQEGTITGCWIKFHEDSNYIDSYYTFYFLYSLFLKVNNIKKRYNLIPQKIKLKRSD